jgi:apolipoprotein N-acyltransferase
MAYGAWRIVQTDDVCTPGPNVTVVQCNEPVSLSGETREQAEERIKNNIAMTHQAAAAKSSFHSDLVALPETIVPYELNDSFIHLDVRPVDTTAIRDEKKREIYDDFNKGILDIVKLRREIDQQFRDIALQWNCALLIGAHAGEVLPARAGTRPMDTFAFRDLLINDPGGLPSEKEPQLYRFNSAYLYQPTGTPPGSQPDTVTKSRYDKVHLVPFSEYMPFRTEWPAAFNLLRNLTPMGLLMPGSSLSPLTLHTRDGRSFRFAAPICYEDVMPQAFRHLAYDADGHKQVDFVVNISNDGWFAGTTELRQHLTAARFRAIENRTWIARSVNCGCTAIIDSAGRVIAELPPGKTDSLNYRLQADRRETLYGRIGDAPGFVPVGLLAVALLGTFIQRRRIRKAARAARAARVAETDSPASGKYRPARKRKNR